MIKPNIMTKLTPEKSNITDKTNTTWMQDYESSTKRLKAINILLDIEEDNLKNQYNTIQSHNIKIASI